MHNGYKNCRYFGAGRGPEIIFPVGSDLILAKKSKTDTLAKNSPNCVPNFIRIHVQEDCMRSSFIGKCIGCKELEELE